MPRPANPHPYHKTVTRWLVDGKQVPASTPGAVKHTTKTTIYYADVSGKTVSLKTNDLQLAWKRLNDLLRIAHQQDLGIHDRYSAHARTALDKHLAAWLAVLRAKGTGQGQREQIEQRLTYLFQLAKWTKLAQITADATHLALAKLQEEGRGAQTRNHYLTHLRGFVLWCVQSERLRKNPIVSVEKINVETDRRHERRAPSRPEILVLFDHLESAPERMGMTGPQRALAYKLAMATGYRANEIRSLTPGSFDLGAATVTLAPAEDKRRRADVHPLPAWLVEELRDWFAAKGGLWDGFPQRFPGRLLKADLAGARQAWIDAGATDAEKKLRTESTFLSSRIDGPHGPLFLDFHALRVFYVTELASQPGMDLKTLMTLARHSTPQLSLNIYAKARQENLTAATAKLLPFTPPER